MNRGAYYNELDPYAAQWLRNLIAAGHIAPGDVDGRVEKDRRYREKNDAKRKASHPEERA